MKHTNTKLDNESRGLEKFGEQEEKVKERGEN